MRRTTPLSSPAAQGAPLLVLALLTACASGPQEDRIDPDQVSELVRKGDYAEAVELADTLVERVPDDAEAEEVRRRAYLGYHLERVRRLSFSGDDAAASTLLEEVETFAAEDPEVLIWRARIDDKLADDAMRVAQGAWSRGEYAAARAGFYEVLQRDPDNSLALAGLEDLDELITWRAGRSEEYYDEGVRANSEYNLSEARSRYVYSSKYAEEDSRQTTRIAEVDVDLARAALDEATKLADKGYWRAALRQARAAAAKDPNRVPELTPLIARYAAEVRADELVEAARNAMVRDRFDQARAFLAEAATLTESQGEVITAVQAEVEEAVVNKAYQRAYDLERDYRYEEAIEAYTALLEGRDGYLDAIARRDTLADYVARAKDLYDRAAKEPDAAARVDLYRQIQLVWPEYKDVERQLEALRASLGTPAPAEG